MSIRDDILTAARQWLETPYHHRARVKGAGVDCLMLIVEAYTDAGLLPVGLEIPDYPPDIMFHADDHSYLEAVLSYCDEVDTPRPGDLALWKFGNTFSHGGIVSDWPTVIHAYVRYGSVVEMNVMDDSRIAKRPVRFFSPRGVA